MVEIEKHIKSMFKGEAFYYVDDSVIYTNGIEEEIFSESMLG